MMDFTTIPMTTVDDYWSRLGTTAPTRPKMVGVLEYDHKTAPRLVQMTAEQAREYRKKTSRPGYGSMLRRVLG